MFPESNSGLGRELPTVSVAEIPPLPSAAMHVLSVARQPSVSAAEVAAALGRDPSIALRILAIANSSFFATTHRITTLQHCVACLGLDFVRAMMVTLGIGWAGATADKRLVNATTLWKHSIGVATCAELIGGRVTACTPAEAYTAGLLHDVGKQVLLVTNRVEYETCLSRAEAENRNLWEVEDDVLGLDHALVGALALREWNLDAGLVHVVLNHHEGELSTVHGKMVAVMQLAHQICASLGYGGTSNAGQEAPDACRRLSLDAEAVALITADLERSVEHVDALIDTVAA